MKTENETRVDRLKRSAFDHPLIAVIIIATASVIAAGKLADAWTTLLVSTGVKPDALDLASESTRGEFSRQLTDVAWRRIYWSNSYTGRVKRNAPPSDVDESWRQYTLTVADWNAQLVTMKGLFDKHYSAQRRKSFDSIHNQFQRVHERLVIFRYEDTLSTQAQREQVAESIQEETDVINFNLCLLVTGLEKSHKKAEEICENGIDEPTDSINFHASDSLAVRLTEIRQRSG